MYRGYSAGWPAAMCHHFTSPWKSFNSISCSLFIFHLTLPRLPIVFICLSPPGCWTVSNRRLPVGYQARRSMYHQLPGSRPSSALISAALPVGPASEFFYLKKPMLIFSRRGSEKEYLCPNFEGRARVRCPGQISIHLVSFMCSKT